MFTRLAVHQWMLRAGIGLAAFAVPAFSQRAAPDPIEGIWTGKVGRPTDRPDITFEFKRDSSQKIRARLYQFAFTGTQLDGEVTRDGDTYSLADFRLVVTRSGDRLEGRLFFDSLPISLMRTAAAPKDPPVPDFPKGPGPIWRTKLGGAIHAPAAVREGVAYVGTTGGMFYAIDVADGKFVWAYAAGRPVVGGALATDSAVYFPCDNGSLIKLDRVTGAERWKYDLGDGGVSRVFTHQVVANSGDFNFDNFSPTPVVRDGVIYIGSGDGSLHAVDANTGARVWRFEAKGKIRGTAAVSDERVVFGTFDNVVYAVDRRTGREVWRRDTRGPVTTAAVEIAGRIIVGNRFGVLAALDPKTGAVAWRQQLWGSSLESEATEADGSRFFVGSSDLRRVAYMDAADGRVLWRTDMYGWAWPRPVATADRVYMSVVGMIPYEIRHLGSLTAIDRATGKIVWRWPAPESTALMTGFAAPPTVAGHHLIVGGLDGTLYAFPAN